jgi:hypothetical protein
MIVFEDDELCTMQCWCVCVWRGPMCAANEVKNQILEAITKERSKSIDEIRLACNRKINKQIPYAGGDIINVAFL